MTSSSQHLAEVQACALGVLDACKTTAHWFAFQESLLGELLLAETHFPDKQWREHHAILKHIGDGIAQTLVHAHTLRQLYKNTPTSANLTNQRDSLAFTLGCARGLAAANRPPLIADLTNLVRIGDVLDCSSREYPRVLEVKRKKPHPQALRRRNRVGRQMARMEAVRVALETGVAQMPGEASPLITRVGDRKYSHEFAHVQRVVEAAIEGKQDHVLVSKHEIILAGPAGSFGDLARIGVEKLGGDEDRHLFIGTPGRLLNEPIPFVPSPSVWPLPIHCRLALLREHVELVHIVDLDVVVDAGAAEGIQFTHGPPEQGVLFLANINGHQVSIGGAMMQETIFGFQALLPAAVDIAKSAAELATTLASNVPEYREQQRTQKTGPPLVPPGALVFPENSTAKPRPIAPKAFLSGPWKFQLNEDGLLRKVLAMSATSKPQPELLQGAQGEPTQDKPPHDEKG